MANLLYLNQFITTSLSVVGGIDASQTTGIVIQSTSGIDTTKPGVACLSYTDPLDLDNAEYIEYSAINSTTKEFTGVTRGAEGYSAKTHSNGVTIAFPVSESHVNRLADALSIGGVATNGVTTTKDEDDMASDSATALATQQSIKKYVDSGTWLKDFLFRQALINGNMDVWQRGTSFTSATTPANNDDTYLMDRWNLISDGNDAVDVSRDTDAPEGSKYSAKFDVETAKRFGIVQILEGVDTTKLKGKTISLSFAVKSANISAIRAALLSWSGTEDTVTSDVVGTWGATPTWATNWTQENTPADLAVTSDWTTVTIEGIDLDSATINNLAVAIWTPNAETIGDIIYISQVQLCAGSVALPFQPKSFESELASCQRYYEKSHPYAQAPTFGATGTVLNGTYGSGVAGGRVTTTVFYAVNKRAASTITTYSRVAGVTSTGSANLPFTQVTTAYDFENDLATGSLLGNDSRGFSFVSGTLTAGYSTIVFGWVANAEL